MHLAGLVGRPHPTLKLEPYQGVLFVHPPKELELLEDDLTPPKEQRVHGTVTLTLPKPREITLLTVKLIAYYTVSLPGHGAEEGILGEYPCELSIAKRLEKGEHTFAWSLYMPRTAAPYERCPYGRVYHRIHATANGPQGAVEGDCVLQVIANPASDGETLDLNQRFTGRSEELGAYLEMLSSEHATVGGVVHYKLHLQDVPSDVRIHSITAVINQSYAVRSVRKPNLTSTPEPHKRRVFKLDGRTSMLRTDDFPTTALIDTNGIFSVPNSCPSSCVSNGRTPRTVVISKETVQNDPNDLAFVPRGGSLIVSHLARLPDDDILRPTTQPGTTDTPIRISHVLVVDIAYTTSAQDTPGNRIMRVQRPMSLSSCCCMLASLLLPSYSEVQDNDALAESKPDAPRNTRPGAFPNVVCHCGFTLERLLRVQHSPLVAAHEETVRGYVDTGSTVDPTRTLAAAKLTPPVAVL